MSLFDQERHIQLESLSIDGFFYFIFFGGSFFDQGILFFFHLSKKISDYRFDVGFVISQLGSR